MAIRTVPITDSKKMLPGIVVYVRIDNIIVLIDFARIGGYVSFFGSIGESHDIFEKLFLQFKIRFLDILPQ